MAFLARYAHIPPEQSDRMTQAEALQIAREVDELVTNEFITLATVLSKTMGSVPVFRV